MNANIGEIVYEQVLSLDLENNPITGATFDCALYLDDTIYSGSSINYNLTDNVRGVFTFSWSADTYGTYQLYTKNNITEVIYMSDIINVIPPIDTNIYIGL
jgi:hypothetical protein